MITRELAVALRDAGLTWHPAEGDRFQLTSPTRELEAEADVFTVSGMTIEARQTPAAPTWRSTARPSGRSMR